MFISKAPVYSEKQGNNFRHLRDLLEASDEEVAELGLDFSVLVDTLGIVERVDLKSGGRHIPVAKHNIREYVQLYVNYHLKDTVSQSWAVKP